MDLMEYIRPELFVLIPVLYIIGVVLKKTVAIKDWLIPYILGIVSILLCVLYLFGVAGGPLWGNMFAAITQGVLCAAASVYANQLYKQLGKKE